MGYFSNGTEGDDYYSRYCAHCVHEQGERECAVWLAHLLFNRDGANNPESVLHVLIPRGADGFNEQCKMFVDRNLGRCHDTADMFGG